MMFHLSITKSEVHHNKNSEFSYLALIRFLMAFIVYAGHYGLVAQRQVLLSKLSELGSFSAILVFLIISGYSIASSFQREMSGFYARRLGRIYPVFFISLTFYLLFLAAHLSTDILTADGTKHGPLPSAGRIIINYFLINGIIGHQILGTSWSLAIETLFYIATPLLFLMVRSKHHVFFLLLIMASAIFYWFHEDLRMPYFATMAHGTAALALFFAWGTGFYFYFHRRIAWDILFPILLCVLINRYLPLGGKYSLYTLFLFSALVFLADRLPLLNRHLTAIFNYLGDISYPLFILHFPLIIFLNYQFKIANQYLVTSILMAISAFVLAFIDKPCRRWIASRKSLQVNNVFIASGFLTALLTVLCGLSFYYYIYE